MTLDEKYIELINEISQRARSPHNVNNQFFANLAEAHPLIEDLIKYFIQNRADTSRSHLVTLLRTSLEEVLGVSSKTLSSEHLKAFFRDVEFIEKYKEALLSGYSSNSDVRRALPLRAFLSLTGISSNPFILLDYGPGPQIHLMELANVCNLTISNDIYITNINEQISESILPSKILAVETNPAHREQLRNLSYSNLISVFDTHRDIKENVDIAIASFSLYQLSLDARENVIKDLVSLLTPAGWLLINDVFVSESNFEWASDWGKSENVAFATYALHKSEPAPLEIFRWRNSHCEEVSAGRDLAYFLENYSTISGNASINS